jgi:hypothetical protein
MLPISASANNADSSATNFGDTRSATGAGQRGAFLTIATGRGSASAAFTAGETPQWLYWLAGGIGAAALLYFLFRKKKG